MLLYWVIFHQPSYSKDKTMFKKISSLRFVFHFGLCVLFILPYFLSSPTKSLAQDMMATTVSAQANIFRAGETTAPPANAFPGGAGVVPVEIDLSTFQAGTKIIFP